LNKKITSKCWARCYWYKY